MNKKVDISKIILFCLVGILSIVVIFLASRIYLIEKTYNQNNNSDDYYQQLETCVDSIKKQTDFTPEILITLGTGLDGLSNKIDVVKSISYKDINGFPQTTVNGHEGTLIFGYLCGAKVVCMKGRIHLYEDLDLWGVLVPIRVCNMLGANKVILTNACGAINESYNVGDFAVANDAITQFITSSLAGPNIDQFGERFTSLNDLYDKEFIKASHRVADKHGITLHDSVYVQTLGPTYETPADIKMFKKLGADTVGMSSLCEAIGAKHANMRVININCISNMGAGLVDNPPTGKEVNEETAKVSNKFQDLICGIVTEINERG
ncbi:MAG: purine-nucleoside phosphorylase [Coriobacteriia bacterium]|nr:purine-nucleoside phosphorylase [Coriobacteriia bacterium]